MTLQELKVLISVQTKQYKAGMKDVQASTNKMTEAVKASTGKMENATKKAFSAVKASTDQHKAKMKEAQASTAQAMNSVKASMAKAGEGSKKALAAVKASTDRLQSSMGRLASMAKTMLSVAAITSFSKQAVAAAQEQEVAEVKLATIMRQRMQASNGAIDSIKALTSAEQRAGIIGDEVQLAGAQQLSTFLDTTGALQTLIPAMNNLVAQQKGYSASAGDAVNVGNLMGKVMQGQTSALTRVGITFTEAEEAVLKYGNEQERAAMLAQVITNNVGQMNSALARTPYGRIQALKNNFSDLMEVIGGAIANVLSPVVAALNTVIVRVISAANAFKSFTAMLTGNTAEPISIAADNAGGLADAYGDVADSASDAAGASNNAGKAATAAANAIKRATMSFDQLHKLSGDSGSGGSGGGGGGGGSGSGGGGGGGGTITGQTYDFGKLAEDGWEFKGMEALGGSIADALANAMDSIPWEKIYKKAEGFGKGLAEFLNGLFDPKYKLFAELGDTIAGAINTAISAESGFVNKLKFENIGNSCAQAVNKSLGGINWKEKLTNATTWGTGIATAANTFIKDTDFTLVGSTVANFLNTKINAAFGFTNTFNFPGLGTKIGTAINGFFKDTDFEKAGKTVSGFLAGAINTAASALQTTDFEQVGKDIAALINGIEWPDLAEAGGALIGGLINAAIGAVKGIVGEKIENIKKTFADAFTEQKNLLEGAGVPIGNAIMGGIGNGIAAVLGDGLKWVTDNIFTPFWNGLKGAFQTGSPAKQPDLIATAGDIGQGILDGIAAKFKNMKTWVEETIVPKLNAGIKKAKGWVTDITMNIKGKKDETFDKIKTAWDSIKKKSPKITAKAEDGSNGVLSTLNGYWTKIKTKTRTLTGKAVNKNSSTLEKLKESWSTIKTKTSTVTGQAVNKTGTVLKNIKDAFASVKNKDVTVTGRANNATPKTLKTLQGSWEKVYDKDATLTAKANFNSYTSNISPTIDSTARITKINVASDATNSWEYLHAMGYVANGGIYAGGQWHDIARYASGGLPNGSQLFWAREAGPELVGTIGGHTAVVNNGQIVSSIASGVYNAVVSAFSAMGGKGQEAPVNEVVVMVDGETMYRIVKRGEKAYNGRYSTVCQVS